LAVPGSGQSVPGDHSAGCFEGCCAAEAGEPGFGVEPFGVVARGDEQGVGGVDADAVSVDERRRGVFDDGAHDLVEGFALGSELFGSATKAAHRVLECAEVAGGVGHPELVDGLGHPDRGQTGQLSA
jgi:hypothetical protein